jgi:hypothetical protein
VGGGIALLRVTVRIWRTDDLTSAEPVITLQTYLPTTDRKDTKPTTTRPPR